MQIAGGRSVSRCILAPMHTPLRRTPLVAMIALAACQSAADAPANASARTGASLAHPASAGVVVRSPAARSEATLAVGDSVVDLVASTTEPGAALLVRATDGRARVMRWVAGEAAPSLVANLPTGFEARGIAAHPAAARYFVTGSIGGHSRILALASDGAGVPTVVFESPRDLQRVLVAPRPFGTDSGLAYRIFFEARQADGTTSLRSVTERGRVEYQVVGPASSIVTFPDEQPGGVAAPSGVPMSVHPRGEPLLWQDRRGCTHSLGYDRGWARDSSVKSIPCDGWTIVTPNGMAYLHWSSGKPGVTVFAPNSVPSSLAASDTFVRPPVMAPDGGGVVGVVSAGGGRSAISFVPMAIPLADVANAWQLPPNQCEARLLASDAGVFLPVDSNVNQLYTVYDQYNYGSGGRVPFLATTDLFWENFGAAFNGVFILLERQRAVPAFWAFVDSANASLAAAAPDTKWARAFAAIAESRNASSTGEAARVAKGSEQERSTVLDSTFDFAELMPRGHYTNSAELSQYFRAVHYLTQIGAKLDPAPLAVLPASVQRSAVQWIDGYRPFVAAPRSQLVWTGANSPAVAPYAKHPVDRKSVFPLSWGLDNEILTSTVYHDKWAPDEQIYRPPPGPPYVRRLHPSGIDIASVYGNPLARSLLADDFATYPRLGPVLDGIRARRPAVTQSSTIYDRWLDALGSEWADTTHFPGAPANSRIWNVKRLQTGLASWATLREATVLVNERADAAEAGEGGFEELIAEEPRGYVEPAPQTFNAIAALYESLARTVGASADFEPQVRDAVVTHLGASASETRRFAAMAERELRGQTLSDSDYAAIQAVAGSAEHQFLIYKSLGTKDEGLPTPDPIAKIADVAGDPALGLLEVAVGNPLEWRQIVPYFGRREIVVGGTYSYYEFVSPTLFDNEMWRRDLDKHARPRWVQPLVASTGPACAASASR